MSDKNSPMLATMQQIESGIEQPVNRLLIENANFIKQFDSVSKILDHKIFDNYPKDSKSYKRLMNVAKVNFQGSLDKLQSEYSKHEKTIDFNSFLDGLQKLGSLYLEVYIPLLKFDDMIDTELAVKVLGDKALDLIKILKDIGFTSKKINQVLEILL